MDETTNNNTDSIIDRSIFDEPENDGLYIVGFQPGERNPFFDYDIRKAYEYGKEHGVELTPEVMEMFKMKNL